MSEATKAKILATIEEEWNKAKDGAECYREYQDAIGRDCFHNYQGRKHGLLNAYEIVERILKD